MKIRIVFSFCLALIFSADTQAREWTASTGHKITGDFVKLENDTVTIALSDGDAACNFHNSPTPIRNGSKIKRQKIRS
ncbi:MAG: hypothetical protein LBT05_15955 [Planctomycetaceae bacterium]|jgi:hypothetical protein|nr:hypothetical protein [Planctomycetaceae bacterium]